MSNTISIRKGLNIRLVGEAKKEIKDIPVSKTVGVSPLDFHGLTPLIRIMQIFNPQEALVLVFIIN